MPESFDKLRHVFDMFREVWHREVISYEFGAEIIDTVSRNGKDLWNFWYQFKDVPAEPNLPKMVEGDLWTSALTDPEWLPTSLNHIPFSGPRPGMDAENIFLERWQALMEQEPKYPSDDPRDAHAVMLRDVLDRFNYDIDQIDASLAASFICWLGTNVGSAFLHQAYKHSDDVVAVLQEWAVWNRNDPNSNRFRRTIEHLMMTDEDFKSEHDSDAIRWGFRLFRPHITVRNLDLCDSLCFWLGTSDGREFVRGCEKQINLEYANKWRKHTGI